MVDANVVISAMVFKSSRMAEVLRKASEKHELCIASYTIEEVKHVLKDKFTSASADIDKFFENYSYTLIATPADNGEALVEIRDPKDYPVIHAAITNQIDVLVTGDRDFFELEIRRPAIVTPAEFMAKY